MVIQIGGNMTNVSIEEILVNRDNISYEDAHQIVEICKERLYQECIDYNGDCEHAYEIIEEELGLEPDYLMDLI